MEVRDFIRYFPKSALSAQYVQSLDKAEQRDLVVSLVDDAIFCDSWEAYFSFAERNNVTISEEVALAAVQAVGLDPLSVTLWVKAANCCGSSESRMNLYEFGLSVPLYNWQKLYAEYRAFAEQNGTREVIAEDECERVAAVALHEKWPDRYARFDTDEEVQNVRRAWLVHVAVMISGLDSGVLARDLQLRRIELAMRQMCCQLPADDSCWYQYALFQLRILEDREAAKKTIESCLAAAGPSFALDNVASVVSAAVDGRSGSADADALPATEVMLKQRCAAESLVLNGVTKDGVQTLRAAGKAAAQQGLVDWKIYSQWCTAEDMTANNSKMAAKVLENGMVCCAHSPSDAVLLGSEAAQYHLLQRHERETLGYAEQQIEQQAGQHHRGRILASWNSLVRIERLLGLSFSKAARRRSELFPQAPILTFLEHCRVGDYLPCSKKTFNWIQFIEDYNMDKLSVEETPFQGIVSQRKMTLAARPQPTVEYESPDDTLWEAFVPPVNSHPPRATDDPDEVTGVRELRGKLVYRVKVDPRTAARCRREERTRRQTKLGVGTTEGGSALKSMLGRVKSVHLTEYQTRRLNAVSADWLVRLLTSSELDLERVLKERAERKQSEEDPRWEEKR
ncbi:hypothetical protein ABB37_06823 [Leptomonas pyrrhocoris]|uniref:Uncharacterized protein n=1 Tax=Leptomonas pyrrhocoris TaxID=157538 RepID=A0A0M9FWN2_LEPPY|nr:hypothetical protein ABB37_06823 [Leptomonas pyrrhocoris]XP_015655856.1 hypothetical protein ABB37_06823 [Leptomonas pyrrhocoris]XP_015655857.1 hypothetical protein ABB37_06823 [Leptomonas pyrrhocoris]XP_015655858.1 hypothetical protein ABB37_06823 [Leptomonas pyrrhocoris]KPA77416.1 hypothetical protein ABB37_06823 [Leptomonas pyrrhocoris]KPA77417.1 hypothetical protein ABB37_06823 [Leptomonas pyrrhocoris]KPA77418.1 hypothetical protein ABB37_06823 [Leptomonas pyrrhocoris]KPA77419.1 hypot|eukprot:XP_015655855.1 hypothetical protein ABB37_06823 [Leptomonas pyrrhocoris]